MSSKLLINVNDATPTVVPDTSAPDTGMFSVSHADGVSFNTSMVLPIVGISILVITIIVGTIVAISRRKKVNRFTTHTNKHLVAKLTTLSVVVLLGALGVMNLDKLSNLASAVLLVDDLKNADDNTLTITASDIKIDVDLNDKAVFATGESTVTVSSATEAGYTLMAYVDSATTDLKNETNKSSKSTIAMLDSTTPAALTDNTWGIATTKPTDQTAEVFTGLPTTQDTAITLKTTEEATTANDKSTFYYGTYITPDLDYGTYSGTTITYIAIANYAGPCNPNATTIQEAKCLQDFAGPNRDQIVDSMTPETQYTLMDMRDEKSYTIAKLYAWGAPDGRNRETEARVETFDVWMTQNLDLDLDSNTTYTNEDTDLGYNPRTQQYETATWTPSLSTYATNDTTWRGSNTAPESYDPGNKYWNGREDTNDDWYAYYRTCSWGPDDKAYDCNESYNPISQYVSSTGIPQYHLGNYYNWTAAAAMNDSSGNLGALIEQSICPSGWTLPRGKYGEDSFSALWSKYNFDLDSNSIDGADALWKSPLYFAASGSWLGSIYEVGYRGNFWSAAISGNGEIHAAFFDVAGFASSSSGFNNIYGESIRCVVRPVVNYVSIGTME
ncbi:hypothetical protein IKT18_00770 [Candidatus Saccharibacteria bacterium]|nr:hypothetical protein [Candidatus Saccharibacteria bacterium]